MAKKVAKKSSGTKTTTKKKTSSKKPSGGIVFPNIEVKLYDKSSPLKVSDAKRLLGWQSEEDTDQSFGNDFLFRDRFGNKIRLTANVTNRPFRASLAARYCSEILRKKWRLNGETWIFDRKGGCQSAQHRLVALIFAEQERQKNPAEYKEQYGWSGPVTMEGILVTGISEKKDVVDTLDLGQKRTLGDVIFRNDEFPGYTNREQARLSNMLSGAIRLAWIRSGGQTVSDAPFFPHSEALDFFALHPGLKDSVKFVMIEDGGSGADGKKISTHVSLAYASALHYLITISKTDPDQFEVDSVVDTSMKEKADDFIVNLASASEFQSVRNALARIEAGGAIGRDEIIGTLVKTANLFVDGEKIDGKKIKVKKGKNDSGKPVLTETPRLGGLDREIEAEDEDEPVGEGSTEEAPKESKAKTSKEKDPKKRRGSKLKKGGWGRAWVKDEDGDHWFGTVVNTYQETEEAGGREMASVKAEDGDQEIFDVPIADLSINYPGDK